MATQNPYTHTDKLRALRHARTVWGDIWMALQKGRGRSAELANAMWAQRRNYVPELNNKYLTVLAQVYLG